jgi:hypothetical protein
LTDFWGEISARHEVLKELNRFDGLSFLGISRELLIDYLNPSVVVDGQHRLLGAIEHSRNEFNSEENARATLERVAQGKTPDEIIDEMQGRNSRVIPISMLMNDSPAEQVFQFVVVNQTATKLSRDLLGTIVSTTLEDSELPPIRDRLESAGIKLAESRVISLVAKTKDSAFYQKISRGIESNANELLAWNVAGALISIFRDLRGGTPFGEKNDYAKVWAQENLVNCEIIPSDIRAKGLEDSLKYWSDEKGPWWPVFNAFWSEVRDFFSSDDAGAFNYWGSPRSSNLFNKVSLTILAVDFFEWMAVRQDTIDKPEDISLLVNKWLGRVNRNYFGVDWNMKGQKKDIPAIRENWTKLWKEYRKAPAKLPAKKSYRNG